MWKLKWLQNSYSPLLLLDTCHINIITIKFVTLIYELLLQCSLFHAGMELSYLCNCQLVQFKVKKNWNKIRLKCSERIKIMCCFSFSKPRHQVPASGFFFFLFNGKMKLQYIEHNRWSGKAHIKTKVGGITSFLLSNKVMSQS